MGKQPSYTQGGGHPLFDVSGKIVAATGGGGVLVGEMCRGLASLGALVAVLDVNEHAACRVAREITEQGGQAIAIETDVLSRSSVAQALEAIRARFGPVDILINGAGGNRKEATTSDEARFFDLPEQAVRWVFDLNFMGILIPSQVFGRQMAEHGSGVILNISSMNAFRPLTRIPAYSAAKAAVSNFTQWLAVHMAQEYSTRIRVNAIAPGFFETEQNKYLLHDARTGELTPRAVSILGHTPLGRFGVPADLLGAVVWLVSEASSFVTGAVVLVDGGFSAFSGV
jgi:NAD(P)-dependent dehydrogenase (short-subunit alcohol dehydrogenase family)